MTITARASGLIQTQNFYPTRNSPILNVTHHTAQCPTQAGRGKFIMEFLQPKARRASAHVGVDPFEIWAGAQEEHTCFAAPGNNAAGLHMEIAAYAEYGRDGWPNWSDPLIRAMLLDKVVPLTAEWMLRWDIPPVVLEPADLLAGKRGMTDHIRCTVAFGGSHWDCGENYPIYEIRELVEAAMGNTPPPKKDDDDMKLFVADNGSLWFVGGSTRSQFISSGDWAADKWSIDHMLRTGAISEYVDPADKSERLPMGALERIARSDG